MKYLMLVLICATFLSCESVNSQSSNSRSGKEIYKTYCVACHGAVGKPKLKKAPDLTVSKMTLEERVGIISKGGKMMPAFAKVISEEEIRAVAVYLDELKELN
ncbi:MAG: cytochrome c [Flavobacteriales bacterium]|nr:cytochrome c [Flavobacteriales bacterium]